jgi:hypothetical protein
MLSQLIQSMMLLLTAQIRIISPSSGTALLDLTIMRPVVQMQRQAQDIATAFAQIQACQDEFQRQ